MSGVDVSLTLGCHSGLFILVHVVPRWLLCPVLCVLSVCVCLGPRCCPLPLPPCLSAFSPELSFHCLLHVFTGCCEPTWATVTTMTRSSWGSGRGTGQQLGLLSALTTQTCPGDRGLLSGAFQGTGRGGVASRLLCPQGRPREPPRSIPATSKDKANSTGATGRHRPARPRSSSGHTATSRQAFWMFPHT